MSNGDDQQMCCAANVCCDKDAAQTELASRLRNHDGTLTENQADEAAKYIIGHFTMLPKSWGLGPVIRQIQQHPYHD